MKIIFNLLYTTFTWQILYIHITEIGCHMAKHECHMAKSGSIRRIKSNKSEK